MSWQARLSWRRLPKPLAQAMSVTVRSVSSRSRRAKWVAVAAREPIGGGADVLGEQPAQVAGRHAESAGQVVLGAAVEGPLADEVDGSAHELGTRRATGALR